MCCVSTAITAELRYSLSFCLFSYSGVCFNKLKLSINDIIKLVKMVPMETKNYSSLGGTII